MAGRLYLVENDESMSLVRAVSPARALNHVVQDSYKVRVATPDDVAEYMSQGGTVEDATIADPPAAAAAPAESDDAD